MTAPGQSPVKLYRAEDVPPGSLDGESIAVLGYGNLGRSAALNLRDSGVKVRIGNRDDHYVDHARSDGFEVVPLTLGKRNRAYAEVLGGLSEGDEVSRIDLKRSEAEGR